MLLSVHSPLRLVLSQLVVTESGYRLENRRGISWLRCFFKGISRAVILKAGKLVLSAGDLSVFSSWNTQVHQMIFGLLRRIASILSCIYAITVRHPRNFIVLRIGQILNLVLFGK